MAATGTDAEATSLRNVEEPDSGRGIGEKRKRESASEDGWSESARVDQASGAPTRRLEPVSPPTKLDCRDVVGDIAEKPHTRHDAIESATCTSAGAWITARSDPSMLGIDAASHPHGTGAEVIEPLEVRIDGSNGLNSIAPACPAITPESVRGVQRRDDAPAASSCASGVSGSSNLDVCDACELPEGRSGSLAGMLVCCDGCVRSFHVDCLGLEAVPQVGR